MLTFLSECTKGSRTCFLQPEPVPDLVLQQWLCPSAHSNPHLPDLSNPFIQVRQNHPPAPPLCPSRAFSISPPPQNICLNFSSAFSLFFFFGHKTTNKKKKVLIAGVTSRQERKCWREIKRNLLFLPSRDWWMLSPKPSCLLWGCPYSTQGSPLPVAGEIHLCSSLGIWPSLQRMARKHVFSEYPGFFSYLYLKWKTMEEKMFEKTGQWVARSHSANKRNAGVAGVRKKRL